LDQAAPTLARPDLINPDIFHDPEHPDVKSATRDKAVLVGQHAFNGPLHEVFAVMLIANDRPGKSPQTGKQINNLATKIGQAEFLKEETSGLGRFFP
jgi:hypothetical protein